MVEHYIDDDKDAFHCEQEEDVKFTRGTRNEFLKSRDGENEKLIKKQRFHETLFVGESSSSFNQAPPITKSETMMMEQLNDSVPGSYDANTGGRTVNAHTQ